MCQAINLHSNSELFDPEIAAMVDVAEDSTGLPEPVLIALARLALMPKELPDGN